MTVAEAMNSPDQQLLDPEIAKIKVQRETNLFLEKPELWETQGWEFAEIKFPFLKITFNGEIAIVVNCRNYDLLPPSVYYANPTNFTPLSYQEIKKTVKKSGRLILDDHPITHLPFICMQGFWEYHTHTSHLNDQWQNYKRTMNINYCVDRAYSVIYE
jgi:hypothetical protein